MRRRDKWLRTRADGDEITLVAEAAAEKFPGETVSNLIRVGLNKILGTNLETLDRKANLTGNTNQNWAKRRKGDKKKHPPTKRKANATR